MTLNAVLLTYTIYPFASGTAVQLTVILIVVVLTSDMAGADDGAIKQKMIN